MRLLATLSAMLIMVIACGNEPETTPEPPPVADPTPTPPPTEPDAQEDAGAEEDAAEEGAAEEDAAEEDAAEEGAAEEGAEAEEDDAEEEVVNNTTEQTRQIRARVLAPDRRAILPRAEQQLLRKAKELGYDRITNVTIENASCNDGECAAGCRATAHRTVEIDQ